MEIGKCSRSSLSSEHTSARDGAKGHLGGLYIEVRCFSGGNRHYWCVSWISGAIKVGLIMLHHLNFQFLKQC